MGQILWSLVQPGLPPFMNWTSAVAWFILSIFHAENMSIVLEQTKSTNMALNKNTNARIRDLVHRTSVEYEYGDIWVGSEARIM